MGGGGGGNIFGKSSPSEIAQQIRNSAVRTAHDQYTIEASQLLNSSLAGANSRDHDLVRGYLDEIVEVACADSDDKFELLFGGSVAKHTYVDGLSDVDSLIVLNESELSDLSPSEVKEILAERLSGLGGSPSIHIGSLCVTVTYSDCEIQLLPAIRLSDGYKIPDESGTKWAKCNPDLFATKLTQCNRDMGNKLVPVIKLAKSIVADYPESKKLSGYHLECMAVEIFKDYKGAKTAKEMLSHFFSVAPTLVLSPVRDRTGQSVFVDSNLGESNSLQRQIISDALSRTSRKIKNAETSGDAGVWEDLLQAQLISRHGRT